MTETGCGYDQIAYKCGSRVDINLAQTPAKFQREQEYHTKNLEPAVSCGSSITRSFGRRSKKTSKLRVTGLCAGNSPGPVNSPHKWPVTRKMFPFDDVIMCVCVLNGSPVLCIREQFMVIAVVAYTDMP